MPLISGNCTGSADDHADPVDAGQNSRRSFQWGIFTLDLGASGPAMIGGPEVGVGAQKGTPLPVGGSVTLPWVGAPAPYNTASTYIARTTAADVVTYTLLYCG